MGSNDPYAQPSGVLRNQLGIRDQSELDTREAALTNARMIELRERPITGLFDRQHYQAVHQYIFQDIYDWAGKLRTVDISKANSFFARSSLIESNLDRLFQNLAKENHLTALSREQFCHRAADYFGELNAVHAFREGNGRTQREFMRQVSVKAGHPISWSKISGTEMIQASYENFHTARTESLEKLFQKATTPPQEQLAIKRSTPQQSETQALGRGQDQNPSQGRGSKGPHR